MPTEGKRPHKKVGQKTGYLWSIPPTHKQLDKWFNDNTVKSYAVLCGAISGNLFVLDFDKRREYRRFKAKHKELAKTLTIRTSRGYHVYLRTETSVKAQKIRGGDLQGEGTYVISPGSVINNWKYTIEIDQPIKQINVNKVNELLTDIAQKTSQTTQEVLIGFAKSETKETEFVTKLIEAFLLQAPKQGRNNALYRVASYASATRAPINQIMQPLARIYAQTEPYWEHVQEQYNSRYTAGERTIRSAYQTNGTAALKPQVKPNTGTLPTALREAILQHTANKNKEGYRVGGSTIPGRLLEALKKSGIDETDHFTIKEAQEIGKNYGISDRSTYEVLRGALGTLNDGRRLFPTITPPPNEGDTTSRTINQNCNDSSSSKIINFEAIPTSKQGSGRKTTFLFHMLTIEKLCPLYDVVPQSWDNLSHSDLVTPKAYRLAMHREDVRRVVPEQSVTYMADRLACHPRTLYRYDKLLGVQITPIFAFIPLNWENVDTPSFYGASRPNGVTPGQWLQRVDGKRFPAIKGIAVRQLSEGQNLVVCERRPSRRVIPDTPMPIYEVIWRRSDLPVGEWDVGGSAYTLPEVGPEPKSVKVEMLPKVAEDIPAPSISIPKIGNEIVSKDNLNLRQKFSLVNSAIDMTLTLVSGIGGSRRDQLFDLGVTTLSELVKADPQRLASAYWYGGYVTLATIARWQEEAAILLGWRERDPVIVEREKREQKRRETEKIYRRRLKKLLKFVSSVFELIDSISPIGDLHHIEPTQSLLKLKKQQDESVFIRIGVRIAELDETATHFIKFYQVYIDNMLSLADWQLDEYGFGERSYWLKQLKRLNRLKGDFDNYDVDNT